MSIATKLQDILDYKSAIKDSINAKGGSITSSTPLSDYSTAIDNLPSGSSDELKSLIDRTCTSITIPQGTTTIGEYALYKCTNLTSLEIPNTITTIKDFAINNCTKIKKLHIPNSVTSIGTYCFGNMTSLYELIFPNNITTILNRLCTGSSNLCKIEIPNSVTNIQYSAFSGCTNAGYIKLSNNLQEIGANALQNTRLGSVIFPDSIQTIRTGVLSSNSVTMDIVIGSGVTTIENSFISRAANSSTVYNIRIKATTPPTLGTNFVPSNFTGKIYVPDANVNDYKNATNWSNYASFIYPISEYVPYDSKIEYLESPLGQQYIQLPYGFDLTDKIEMKVSTKNVDNQFLVSSYIFNDDNNNRFAMGGTYNSKFGIRYGSNSSIATITNWDSNPHIWKYENQTFSIDETTLSQESYEFSSETSPLRLFYYSQGRRGKIYYFKQWKNDTLVLDLIPVRLGNAAGMYDRVNEIFFESTSGNNVFVLGPDIT